MSGFPSPAAPEGGFVLAIVVQNQPVAVCYRAYSSDFDPADVLNGSGGRYAPFDENEADSLLLHEAGLERTTAWERFSDDGYGGSSAEWGAVVQPATRIGPGW